jgi:hypothetical protein
VAHGRPTSRWQTAAFTEFKSANVRVTESPCDETDSQVYGLPVIVRGEPYVDADGAPILSPSMPLLPSTQESPETRLT